MDDLPNGDASLRRRLDLVIGLLLVVIGFQVDSAIPWIVGGFWILTAILGR